MRKFAIVAATCLALVGATSVAQAQTWNGQQNGHGHQNAAPYNWSQQYQVPYNQGNYNQGAYNQGHHGNNQSWGNNNQGWGNNGHHGNNQGWGNNNQGWGNNGRRGGRGHDRHH